MIRIFLKVSSILALVFIVFWRKEIMRLAGRTWSFDSLISNNDNTKLDADDWAEDMVRDTNTKLDANDWAEDIIGRDNNTKLDADEWMEDNGRDNNNKLDANDWAEDIIGRDNNTKLDDDEWMEEQRRRKSLVKKLCEEHRELTAKDIKYIKTERNRFLYDTYHKLFNCRHEKVAGTTLHSKFMELFNKRSKREISGLRHKAFQAFRLSWREKVFKLAQQSLTFSVTRHPFERLVSAYQNKVIEMTQKNKLRKIIKTRFGNFSFKSFVLYVIADHNGKCRSIYSCKTNVHWRPYISRCLYCHINYTVLVKDDTFDMDLDHIWRMAGVKKKQQQVNMAKKKIKTYNRSSHGSTAALTRRYFRKLPRPLAQRLYELYRWDFQMFNYDAHKYIDLCANTSVPNREIL